MILSSTSLFSLILVLCGAVVERPVEVENEYIRFIIDPKAGGTLTHFGFRGDSRNFALGPGLIQEGFGVGSRYVPNRRLNERLDVLDDIPDRPMLRYDYDCDGPNIRGLHVQRLIEPLKGEASLRVTWRIDNRGNETHWVAPWVRNFVAPGGTLDDGDRLDFATTQGLVSPRHSGYFVASRNWVALTDPQSRESVYFVFDADDLYAIQSIVDNDHDVFGFSAAFLPRTLRPQESWETTYRINLTRGLSRVSFATDELAAQLDFAGDALTLLLSPARAREDVQFFASMTDGNETTSRLKAKTFSLFIDDVVRCTYPMERPIDGVYEFVGELRQEDAPVALGADTDPPHGGIDTQFVVGRPPVVRLEPWTDTPFKLDRGRRTLKRNLAVSGATAIWFESPLVKIFTSDRVEPSGPPNPSTRLTLAGGERESFQIVIRPPVGPGLRGLRCRVNDLIHTVTGDVIPGANVELSRVGYVPVRVPSHFENPTGMYPDPLLPLKSFTAPGGQSSAVWVTVYVPVGTRAGVYRGALEILSLEEDPIDLWIEVEVLDFVLPVTPALKTDFGYSSDVALAGARERGYDGSSSALDQAYLRNAIAHRVTLRELTRLPTPNSNYAESLTAYKQRLPQLLRSGISSIAAPPSLLYDLPALAAADAFVESNALQDRVFSPIAVGASKEWWGQALDRIDRWKSLAPNIPLSVTTGGVEPFLAESAAIWCLHVPVFDTANGRQILSKIAAGGEVWWYVDAMPPRPYGNFLTDFAAIEHRILFWQAWALGISGFQYDSINQVPRGQNPYAGLLDSTPANGNSFLVYPGSQGPVNSIRWETIRDGVEDYDYLTILMSRIRAANTQGGMDALIEQAAEVIDLRAVIPNLTGFTRDPVALETKRVQLGRMIVVLGDALGL